MREGGYDVVGLAQDLRSLLVLPVRRTEGSNGPRHAGVHVPDRITGDHHAGRFVQE